MTVFSSSRKAHPSHQEISRKSQRCDFFAELRKKGHLITSYIDDSFLVGRTLKDCENNLNDMVSFSEHTGFIIHAEKSVLTPSQTILIWRLSLTPSG